ncbi:flagellar filament capping protein FliD [Clostridium beijerinckii]|uniref:Flagellar hook-associated protein 2 n=1 Tax=Clostridium beijerinckii TaxID=1520 RepID=A0AAW3W8B0_CLOBE|nr:flagellar filament capping protein FliD [Clostridium beijerinckii]MBC2455908.1 flagellar filament capping protein FliD [Clostridium beijerinckii]MBC2474713.1 flagellar filament capping protein FliD [Clostridium beijerinckii]MDG5852869.1 flagellar filament capping protein FliD [Clostridium beijerinckii]NOV61863.1 flagellar hook-associated protein 2 [Clostridium beijerinckii]NOV68641.1 flagellar hook-associated protein 2 [Clostridium beijerinckii]
MSNTTSTNRITGLTGLLDTDSLVTASMKPYKLKVDTAKQKEQILEWKQQQYRAIMKSSNDFYTKYLTSTGSSSLITPSAFNAVKFTSSDSSVVTATTGSGASVDNYSISVTQLASKASTTIKTTDLSSSSKITFTMGAATPIEINTTYLDTTTGTTKTKTNSQIVSELNAAFTANSIKATAKNSDFSQGIILESTDMGSDVSFQADIAKTDGSTISTGNVAGKNLIATITNSKNQQYEILDTDKFTSNSKTIDGVTFNFTGVTKNSSGTDVPAKLTGSIDVTDLKNKIVSFINDYNSLLSSINTKIYETRDKSYTPLTDDQKKEMSDDEIKKWETKAQTGLLRRDSNLQDLAASMKDAMSGIFGSGLISSSGLTLESIGIQPVKDYTDKNGLYTIDEEKLTQALSNNLDGVKELFIKNASSTDLSNAGIVPKLGDVLYTKVKKSNSVFNNLAGDDSGVSSLTNDLTKQITEMKQKISDMEDDLTDRENRLYSKYAKLESSLSELQSQQNSFSSYFSSN